MMYNKIYSFELVNLFLFRVKMNMTRIRHDIVLVETTLGVWYMNGGAGGQCYLKGAAAKAYMRAGRYARTLPHAKPRTETRFWRSQILGILPGNASKFEQGKSDCCSKFKSKALSG